MTSTPPALPARIAPVVSTAPDLDYRQRDMPFGQRCKRRDGQAIPHLPNSPWAYDELSQREYDALFPVRPTRSILDRILGRNK